MASSPEATKAELRRVKQAEEREQVRSHIASQVAAQKAKAPNGTLWCSGVQRVGRAKGLPCSSRASTTVNGKHYCGTHARLIPDGRREVAALGRRVGNKVYAQVGFEPKTFETVRRLATDEGASFSSMTRVLVDYALDEVAVQSGQNDPNGAWEDGNAE